MSKIGIDIRASQLGSGSRGIGKYIVDLVEGVSSLASEHEFYLLALSPHIPPRLQALVPSCRIVIVPTPLMGKYQWLHPVPKVWRIRYLRLRSQQAFALKRVVRKEKIDKVHLTSPMDEQFFADAKGLPCDTLITFHDAIPAVFPAEFIDQWPQALRYVYQLKLAAIKEAQTVVAISESARQDAIEYAGVPEEKIHVVYNTVGNDFHSVDDTTKIMACRQKFGISSPYFLFCSAPEFTKNRARLVQAFAQFLQQSSQHYQLVMVSPKEENSKTDVRRIAFDAGLSGRNLLFTGFVSDEELNLLYAGATALLSPSLYEGFGLPAGQAMRAGTPVIASDRSAQPEVVGDAGLLVDPYDVGAITRAMQQLAESPELCARLSARGKARVQRFDQRHQAEAMLSLYSRKERQAGIYDSGHAAVTSSSLP